MPFKSKAQQKYMYAALQRKKEGTASKKEESITPAMVKEMSDKTKSFKKLPEHAKKGK